MTRYTVDRIGPEAVLSQRGCGLLSYASKVSQVSQDFHSILYFCLTEFQPG